MKKNLLLCLLFGGMLQTVSADDIHLPTMGWSSWNCFGLDVSYTKIQGQALALTKKGLDTVGYKYINIDDGFMKGRDPKSDTVIINKQKFPYGIRSVADYIHKKGLKAGIYTDAGDNTCGSGNTAEWGCGVGFYGHEDLDAKMYFDKWDFDFIKVDFCGGLHAQIDEKEAYTRIREAIDKCDKKDIVYNVCRWGYPGTWISDIADSWRMQGDIYLAWESLIGIILENLYMGAFMSPGHYNDMDMLEIGRGKDGWGNFLTTVEEKTHMAMWCFMASPLLIGCDLNKISKTSLEILMNTELIAINQDSLSAGPYVTHKLDSVYVMVRDLKENHGPTRAIAVWNMANTPRSVNLALADLGYASVDRLREAVERVDAEDCLHDGTIQATVPAHGTLVFVAHGQRCEETVYEAEAAWKSCYQKIRSDLKSATVVSSGACSGGVKVANLGKGEDNRLEWHNVWSDTGGEYELTLYFLSAGSRNVNIVVNDDQNLWLNNCNSGTTSRVNSKKCNVLLRKGMNTICMKNDRAYMPDLDRFTLRFLRIPEGIKAATGSDVKKVEYYDLQGRKTVASHEGVTIQRTTYTDGSHDSKKRR